MRLFLRIAGTWLIGLALVLLVIDGTKSLAAGRLVLTPLHASWAQVHADSLVAAQAFLESRLFAAILEPTLSGLLAAPGFLVIGVPGILLALLGRTEANRYYVHQDRI